MNFEIFLKNLNVIKNTQLPGIEAQFKLAPKMRLEYNRRKNIANNPKIASCLFRNYWNQFFLDVTQIDVNSSFSLQYPQY